MNSTTDDTFLQFLQSIPQTLYGTVGLALFVVGTIGNLLDIISFSRLANLNRLPSSLFLLASFIGSQMALITGLLPRLILGLAGSDHLSNSLILCKSRSMLQSASATFSMACVCFAAMDRYFLSCLDLRQQKWMTLKQARLTIVITAILCLALYSPYAIFYAITAPSTCSIVNPVFVYVQTCLSLILYNLAPVVILSIICILTWRNLGQQVAFYLRGPFRCYDHVTLLIFGQIMVILVTTCPAVIWLIYKIATQKVPKSSLRLAKEAIAYAVCVLPAFCPYSIMFYVYLIISPIFRRNVKRLFLWTHQILPMGNREPVRKSIEQLELRHLGAITLR